MNLHIMTHRSQLIRVTALLLVSLSALFLMIPTPVQAAIGVDGDLTIPADPNPVILNRYTTVSAITANTITVGDITDLKDNAAGHFANEDLSSGDLILIYQAQGALFTDNDDVVTYGAFTYEDAGHYEFALVASVSGNDITVDTSNTLPYSCNGISNTYNPTDGHVQVIRVPQYTNLTIDNGATVTANPWDGDKGGIVSLHVRYDLVINGQIDVSGMGFRGGEVFNKFGANETVYRGIDNPSDFGIGGNKGESILGYQTVYEINFGNLGRGAPANGGGGGNAHNAGGGGGANGYAGSGTWDAGYGFIASNDSYAAAWDLDDGINDVGNVVPSYFQNGAGGGRGGYSFSDVENDATIVKPCEKNLDNNFSWRDPSAGDKNYLDGRCSVGGLGGRPLNNNPSSRLFLGGGGGSGDVNNLAGTPGGNGGGLVILTAENTSGTGSILGDGDDAADTTDDGPVALFDDGAGGGGAGGSIVLKTKTLSTNTLTGSANGGDGGDQLEVTTHPVEGMGPGGGGGGGYIATASNNGSFFNATVLGGDNGITESTALTEFPPNGATKGYSGGTSLTFNNANAFLFPGCSLPTAITLQTFSAIANFSWLLPIIFISLMIATFVVLTSSGRRQKNRL